MTVKLFTRKEMNEEEIINLRKQNAFLQQQLEEANRQIGILTQQNADIKNQNGEINAKLNLLLDAQTKNNTLCAKQHNLTKPNLFGKRSNENVSPNNHQQSKRKNIPTLTNPSGTSDDDKMESESDNIEENNKNEKENNIQFTSWAEAVENDQHNQTSSKKPSPMQLRCYDKETTNRIYQLISENFGDRDYQWRQLNIVSPARIYCDNSNVKGQIGTFLQQNNIEFNSYADSTNRLKAFIVRGLVHGDDNSNIANITSTLNQFGIDGDIGVDRFITGNMKRNPNTSPPLYKVTLVNDADVSKITQIKNIGSFQVSIERMKRSSIVQCHRCQRYNHTSNQCNFKYRCVQCVHQHPPGQCPRITNKKLPLGCVNCHENKLEFAGHTANNLINCGFFNNKFQNNNKSSPNAEIKIPKRAPIKKNTSAINQQTNDLIENTATNNPKMSNKRVKRFIKKYRPNVPTGKSITNDKSSAPKNISKNAGRGQSHNMGDLIATLLSILQNYS